MPALAEALKTGDEVVSCDVARDDAAILMVTDAGFGKRTQLDKFNRQGRGGQGVRGATRKCAFTMARCATGVLRSGTSAFATSGGTARMTPSRVDTSLDASPKLSCATMCFSKRIDFSRAP